ncbi:ATP-binding protein [Billgrantia desiderata]|uniref:ATP-binding protein n=1 Tax=Billgrantia desiderata TaxID=52021 RepID=UPI001F22F94B
MQTDPQSRADLLEQLEEVSTQLLQSEKLAAIGQLAAGVAHEINNPIGYVFSNLRTLANYVEDLISIVDVVDTVPSLEELRRMKQRLDYDYIREDVKALLTESEEGVERVKSIITALKDFSHIDEEGFRLADIHEGLESTLKLVNSELKYKAEVVREYAELPEVECLPSQLNQVVLNLLTNAVQAIGAQGRIVLRTGHEGNRVWFEIEDTGSGIEPEHLSRIFEPFFTTKAIGQGTGLGLALSFSIIKKHQGHIEAFSQVGQGSRFRVWLPIVQPLSEEEPSRC